MAIEPEGEAKAGARKEANFLGYLSALSLLGADPLISLFYGVDAHEKIKKTQGSRLAMAFAVLAMVVSVGLLVLLIASFFIW
jgi:hypothetical protein